LRLVAPLALATFSALSACSGSPGAAPEAQTTNGQDQPGSFCDAFAVIQAKCVRCHSDPPQHGAPFALTDYAATQEPAPTSKDPERTRADRMLSAVASDFMPDTALALEPPVEALTCEEKATLLAWLDAGAPAPASEADCGRSKPHLLACDEAK
jgi:uncharacterized membrane protein